MCVPSGRGKEVLGGLAERRPVTTVPPAQTPGADCLGPSGESDFPLGAGSPTHKWAQRSVSGLGANTPMEVFLILIEVIFSEPDPREAPACFSSCVLVLGCSGYRSFRGRPSFSCFSGLWSRSLTVPQPRCQTSCPRAMSVHSHGAWRRGSP